MGPYIPLLMSQHGVKIQDDPSVNDTTLCMKGIHPLRFDRGAQMPRLNLREITSMWRKFFSTYIPTGKLTVGHGKWPIYIYIYIHLHICIQDVPIKNGDFPRLCEILLNYVKLTEGTSHTHTHSHNDNYEQTWRLPICGNSSHLTRATTTTLL